MRPPLPGLLGRSPARRPLAFLALACAALGLCFAPCARAVASSGLVVIPRPASQPGLSYFKLEAQPGSAQTAGAIEILNPTAKRLRILLTPVDGETLGTLGSDYAPPGSSPHGSALWLHPARRVVVLPPGAKVAVPISVIVPIGARPGDYLSGVSVETLNQTAGKVQRRGVSVASVSRYAIGVEASLPGARHPRIQFTGAAIQRQPAGTVFLLRARNSGNVILQGVHGYVRVTRAGHTVVSRAIEAGTFVAGTRIAYPVTAYRQTPPQGTRYRVSAWMSYPGGIARLSTTVTFGHRQAVTQQQYGGPRASSAGTAWWKTAGLVAAIVYSLLTTVLLLRRRERRPREIIGQ